MTLLARHQLHAIINRSTIGRLNRTFGHWPATGSNDNHA